MSAKQGEIASTFIAQNRPVPAIHVGGGEWLIMRKHAIQTERGKRCSVFTLHVMNKVEFARPDLAEGYTTSSLIDNRCRPFNTTRSKPLAAAVKRSFRK